MGRSIVRKIASGVAHRFADAPIRKKLQWLLGTSLAIAITIISGAFVAGQLRLLMQSESRQIEALASVVGANATAALEFGDIATAQELLASMARQKSLQIAAIYDAQGRPFAQYINLDNAHEASAVPVVVDWWGTRIGRFIEVVEPMVQKGRTVGYVYARAEPIAVRQQFRSQVMLGIGVVALAALAAVWISIPLQHVITYPVLELTEAMRSISRTGNLSVRVPVRSADEIGSLAWGFNTLLVYVQETQQALLAVHAELEERVRQRTAALEEAKLAAEQASLAKSQFLANMSHEIRTPMTAILGYTDLLADSTTSEEARQEYIQTIRRNGTHLLGLINDILDLSKIESGKFSIHPVDCNPLTLLGEVLSLLRPRAVAKRLTLSAECRGEVPSTIRTDPMRLRQILVNLLGNAVKFTEHGGVRVEVRFDKPAPETAPEPQGMGSAPSGINGPAIQGILEFAVIDTGPGIAKEDQGKIFDAFVQVDDSMSRRYGGTGLGLTITRRLAELLGGEILLDSELGKGSVFRVRLPIAVPPNAEFVRDWHETALPARTPDRPAVTQTLTLSGRILLVEDGPDNQRLIAFLLKKAGAEVVTASNGQEGIAAVEAAEAEKRPFDCILMDMQMPVLDGYSATRLLRERGCRIPIIAITAHAMQGDRDTCLAAGCDDYLSKPIQRGELIRMAWAYTARNGREAASRELATQAAS